MKLRSIYHSKLTLYTSHAILWAAFQIYGNSHAGILTKCLGISQLLKLLRDSEIISDTASKSSSSSKTSAAMINGKAVKITKLSVSQLELEVKKLKKKTTESSAVGKSSSRIAMSSELSFAQFIELLPQVAPLVFGNIAVAEAQNFIDFLIRKSLLSTHSKLGDSLLKSFRDSAISYSGLSSKQLAQTGSGVSESSNGHHRFLIASIWSNNREQMRKIYDFYANEIEPCRLGRGLVKKMMNFEDLWRFLKDFGVMPRFIDLPSLQSIYRACKLWEWSHAFGFLAPESEITDEESELMFSLGNLSLSLPGLLELLSRVSHRSRLDNEPVVALRSLLKIMDCSRGKHILSEASRGSIVIKVFSTSLDI